MLAARIHEYQKPLLIEDIPTPILQNRDQVIIKIEATGLCHSDIHLINGEWKQSIPLNLPVTPGHEICGRVEEIGAGIPNGFLNVGDTVAVFGGWGCGVCFYCKGGNEQSCSAARWPGIFKDGGFSQYMLVDSYRFLVNVDTIKRQYSDYGNKVKIDSHHIAPLTDAGLTPYRAIKKIKSLLGPSKSIGIMGIGGLGYYAVQYAKILGQTSTVVAFDRKDKKLELSKKLGVDFALNIYDGDFQTKKEEILKITGGNGLDVIIDCVGAESTINDSMRLLNKNGTLVIVGLFGNLIKVPLVSTVINEQKIIGSLWGNYNELKEVITLQMMGQLKHDIIEFPLDQINNSIELLKTGDIFGRAVIIP